MSSKQYCRVCGKYFEFCPNCNRVPVSELWRSIYCSDECHQIFHLCMRVAGNSISQEDAYNALISYHIKEKNLQPSVKATVDKVMSFKSVEIEGMPTSEVEVVKSVRPRRRRTKKVDTE